jgi:LmbE family N-acetylglucosaminyl deacetylase
MTATAKRVFPFFILFIFSCLLGSTQTPATYNSADIYLQLNKLNVLGSVLYIAAHPDDENNGLLPYFAKDKMYRTGYLSLTRGDGGQNLLGSEQGIELGLIRTQELLAARRMDGAEQFFTRAYEFGFSKSAEESLRIWGKEKVLSDIVWVIRSFQPDVIITRFPGDARAGHGHHAASSLLANEAFTAAADPSRFPEQFNYGVKPWQAKRILWNTFNFGGNNTTSEDQLKLAVGSFNPLLGESYGEIGGEARSMHKSQGTGSPRRRGESYEYFSTTGGDTPKDNLMDGITIDWNRIDSSGNTQRMINNIIKQYDLAHPEYSVDDLVELYKYIQHLPSHGLWWQKKSTELQDIIMECSGIFAEVTSDNEYAVQGEKMNLNFFVNKRNNSNLQLERIDLNTAEVHAFDSSFNINLPVNQNITFNKTFTVSNSKQLTQPYWLAAPMDGTGTFKVDDQRLIGNAESAPAYTARFTFKSKNISFMVKRPVQYKYTDPVRGEVYQPFVVITPLVVYLTPGVLLINVTNDNKQVTNPKLSLRYKSNFTANQIPVTVNLKQSEKVIYTRDTVVDFEAGKIYGLDLPVRNIYNNQFIPMINAQISITVNNKPHVYEHYLRSIKYDHIPDIHYFYKDNIHILKDEIKVVGKKIGYIIGAGDMVPDALEQLGYEVKYLSEADLTDANLKQLDAIIVGIRAYNIYEYLSAKNDVLNRYVQNGGNLIVQYLKSNQVGTKPVKAGPYHFVVNGGSRVTEENAKVNFILPAHPVLNYPNKITDKDFEGWVQERSTYQAEQLDPHFETPLSMKDSGDRVEGKGSLAIAKYGKGNFVYMSLVLFRQLPAGVQGSYRLLANVIALQKN